MADQEIQDQRRVMAVFAELGLGSSENTLDVVGTDLVMRERFEGPILKVIGGGGGATPSGYFSMYVGVPIPLVAAGLISPWTVDAPYPGLALNGGGDGIDVGPARAGEVWMVSYHVGRRQAPGAPATYQHWISQNGLVVPGSRSASFAAGKHFGTGACAPTPLTLANGDTLRTQYFRVVGASNAVIQINAARMTLVRVA